MKFLIFSFFSLCFVQQATAQAISNCKNPAGFGLFHHSINKNKKIEFEKESITGGMLSIVQTKDKKFDLLVVDSRKKISSMVQDGGDFVLLRKGQTDITFLLYFKNSSIELYTLWLDGNGKAKLDMLQSRGGDLIELTRHKSSLLTADCDMINFDLIE